MRVKFSRKVVNEDGIKIFYYKVAIKKLYKASLREYLYKVSKHNGNKKSQLGKDICKSFAKSRKGSISIQGEGPHVV